MVYLLIIALIVSGGTNYKYVKAAKNREILSEHFLYYAYKSSIESYFDSIILIDNAIQIKSDSVVMKEKIGVLQI